MEMRPGWWAVQSWLQPEPEADQFSFFLSYPLGLTSDTHLHALTSLRLQMYTWCQQALGRGSHFSWAQWSVPFDRQMWSFSRPISLSKSSGPLQTSCRWYSISEVQSHNQGSLQIWGLTHRSPLWLRGSLCASASELTWSVISLPSSLRLLLSG